MIISSNIRRMSAIVGILLFSQQLYPNTVENGRNEPDTLQQTHELEELVVSGTGSKGRLKTGHVSMSGSGIRKAPVLLGEADVIKALQASSGVVSGTEGFAGFYVRGGETDQNLYLLDGLPLLNIYHFGGLFSIFCPESIERADFYKGSFPSRYSGRVSGIIDITMRKPDFDKTTGSFSVGLISGQFYMSTPLKKGHSAVSVALRRTWLDLISLPALVIMNRMARKDGKKTMFHYDFTDLCIKLDADDLKGNEVSVLLFWGKDNFRLGSRLFDSKDTGRIYHSDNNKMNWGNLGLTVSYRHSFHLGELRINPYFCRSFSLDYKENSSAGADSIVVSSTSEVSPSVLQAGMTETFHIKPNSDIGIEVGLQQSWHKYDSGNPGMFFGDMQASSWKETFPDHSYNTVLSAFADLSWNIAEPVQVSSGMRGDRYISNGRRHWNIEPRLNLRIDLPHTSYISAGYSRTVQYAQQVSSNYIYLPTDTWIPTASQFRPLKCDLYSVAYSKNFFHGFSINAEAWWKEMKNLAEYHNALSEPASSQQSLHDVVFGKGWSYGLDVDMTGGARTRQLGNGI